MATALEFYKANTVTPANFTGGYATYLSCVADRSALAGTKNFFIIAHIATTVNNIDTTGKVRLQVDGVDYGECADGLYHEQSDLPSGYTYNFVKRLSLDNSSHTITLDCGRVLGANNFQAQNASIVILEESANAQYNDSTTETGTGAATGWVDYLTLSFTPGATENYLIVASCETKSEDESDSGVKGIQLDVVGTVVLTENHGELGHATNDRTYRTVGMACFKELASGASRTIKLQMQGNGAIDEVYCRKGAIIAIPFSDFENVYTDSQAGKTFHTGTSFSDTDVVLSNQAVNAADHLVIAAAECSNESPIVIGYWQLVSAGTNFVVHQFRDRDEDTDEYYLEFAVHGVTLTSGNQDFEIEGNSSSTSESGEGCVRNAYLIVAEIPPAPAIGRRIFITHV